MSVSAGRARALSHVDCHERIPLTEGWRVAAAPPDLHADPLRLDQLEWVPARVPGTAAAALLEAGMWQPGQERDFDAEDWWFRTSFTAEQLQPDERVDLLLGGLATVAQVYLNGQLLLSSDSMFAAHAIDASPLLQQRNELAVRCRALRPLLDVCRGRRARWRTGLADGRLRFFRTTLLGRADGFAPGPAPVGPWREVVQVRRRRLLADSLKARASLVDGDGLLELSVRLRALSGTQPRWAELQLDGPSGAHHAAMRLAVTPGGWILASGRLLIPGMEPWWPHTHGDPVLHDVRLLVDCGEQPAVIRAGELGFRTLSFSASPADWDLERDGLDIHINGVPVFARGAVWTPVDPIGLSASSEDLRGTLELVRDAGMNMLRLPGTGVYESRTFHDLCDRLGILVWQDLMLANFDYPLDDPKFAYAVEQEAIAALNELGGRPSLAVLCGGSEIEQQAAMMGRDPSLACGPTLAVRLPELVSRSGVDAAYVPSAPCGGALPFRTDRGIANYYGVGAYRRPLSDARLAAVRFAAECLAFANVPCSESIAGMLPDAAGRLAVHHPVWKAGVPRDAGAGWDFDDVRDHYLRLLFDIEPHELRRSDHERYFELSRAVTGEVMAETFGEWRRARSVCTGALVLWLRDLRSGAGWGVIDSRGEPKAAYHDLRRALAPVAVWTTDEGLNGVAIHVANDRPWPLTGSLRVALYRDREHRVADAVLALRLAAHETQEHDVEQMLGRFVDASWAYRFGAPVHDLLVVTLEDQHAGRPRLLSQALRFPAVRPSSAESAERMGLRAAAAPLGDGTLRLTLDSRRLVYRARAQAPGFRAVEEELSVEPGVPREVLLRPLHEGARFIGGVVHALNLDGTVPIEPPIPIETTGGERDAGDGRTLSVLDAMSR